MDLSKLKCENVKIKKNYICPKCKRIRTITFDRQFEKLGLQNSKTYEFENSIKCPRYQEKMNYERR